MVPISWDLTNSSGPTGSKTWGESRGFRKSRTFTFHKNRVIFQRSKLNEMNTQNWASQEPYCCDTWERQVLIFHEQHELNLNSTFYRTMGRTYSTLVLWVQAYGFMWIPPSPGSANVYNIIQRKSTLAEARPLLHDGSSRSLRHQDTCHSGRGLGSFSS